MSVRQMIIIACMAVIAAVSIFGLFYDPGHPWMDTKRKIGAGILFGAGTVGLVAIMASQF